jgi:signal transduction histidine kinase
LAIAALADLDRAINGGAAETRLQALLPGPLVEAAAKRWRSRAAMAGGRIELSWGADRAPLLGDPVQLSQALDNLIVNALEHGGPRIRIEAEVRSGRLRIAVLDDGRRARAAQRVGTPGEVIARLLGRGRRGHGLGLVREVAAQHGGRFALHRSDAGSAAVLELPLARDQGSIAA